MNETSNRISRKEDVEVGASDYEHITVENGDSRVECTIFPRDCDEAEIVTHWITAGGDSFVSLREMR